MDEQDKGRAVRRWLLVAAVCGVAVGGIFRIVHGWRRYEVWDIVDGVALCLVSAGVYASYVARGRYPGRPIVARLTTGGLVAATALVLLSFAMPLAGVQPFGWVAGGAPIAPSVLARHPLVYNHLQVETSGYVVGNERGWCMLRVEGPHAPGDTARGHSSAIVLAASGLNCKPGVSSRGKVAVSGTFEAFRTSKDVDIPYVLEDAKGIPASVRAAPSGF